MIKTSAQARGADNKQWGHEAEQIAAEWLMAQGYVIRERNWRMGRSVEIDIIAEIPGTMVFIEVKARTGDTQSPAEAVDAKKKRRMIRGADKYLQQFSFLFKYRFDIITITGNYTSSTIDHFQDAFMPELR